MMSADGELSVERVGLGISGLRIIACATVAEELANMGVGEEVMRTLDFALHVYPERLRENLQREIDETEGDCDILLGYGKCSNALEGLKTGKHRLIIPAVDDCISLFLGSRDEYLRRQREEPGTYYLTRGWVIAQMEAFKEYLKLVNKYGELSSKRVVRALFANYRRVALIDTGNYALSECRSFAKDMASFLELEYVEIPGSLRLLKKAIFGMWDEEFLVVDRGSTVRFGEASGRFPGNAHDFKPQ